jgi:hypothetical protein
MIEFGAAKTGHPAHAKLQNKMMGYIADNRVRIEEIAKQSSKTIY